ncbi:MFS general substrate transporter [Xylariaceae sp. FL0804]|nr:MFS general substrate transporter [Xylariaceae sp. FL0804]
MGLGVLEDRHLRHVPGTALLTDVLDADEHRHHHRGAADTTGLRHAGGRDADVVLVPQPSGSPNDPLNWPLWKKDLALLVLCVDTAVVGAWGPMLTPGFVDIAAEFGMSYNALNAGLGWGVLVIGLSCFFTNSAAVVWGRRPVLLGGNLLLFVSSLGSYFAHDFNTLLGLRVIGCIGMSPFEVLVATTIADIYFVHQRGVRLAAWGLCLSIGVGGSSIISGYIIQDLGWNWTYGICAVLFGVWMIVLFLFCPETAYRRDEALNIDAGTDRDRAEMLAAAGPAPAHDPASSPDRLEKGHESPDVEMVERAPTHRGPGTGAAAAAAAATEEKKHSYWHELKIYHGRVSDEPYHRVLVRPLLMLVFPQVLFSFFAYGLTTSWLIVVGGVLAQLFTAPPYSFSTSQVGLVSVAALVGSLIGALSSGPAADGLAKALARRNGGVYEPEFRLALVAVPLALGGAAFFGFGWSLQARDPWAAPAVWYGVQYFAVGYMTIAVYGYLTDCHRERAPEAFAAINLRNIYSFGMNYFISDWITGQGPKEVFCIIGGVHVFICLCAVPMYVFGKRCRSWTSRKPLFEKVMRA